MLYLLDTNVIIDHLRGKKLISEEIMLGGAAVSVITLAELFCGAEKSANPNKQKARIEKILNETEVLPVTLQNVQIYAQERARLEKAGIILEYFDLLIAATALSYEATLVTNNQKHFARIKGLKLLK